MPDKGRSREDTRTGSRICGELTMANFQDSKFLGVSPKAFGLIVVAGLTIVGLFFMPETLKFLFDAEREVKLTRAPSKENDSEIPSRGEVRASMSKAALDNSGKTNSEASIPTVPSQSVGGKRLPTRPKSGAGILSGLDFSIKANRASGGGNAIAPDDLNFSGLLTPDSRKFFEDSAKSVTSFSRQHRLKGMQSGEAVARLSRLLAKLGSGDTGNESEESLGIALKKAHVDALRALYEDYDDRGLLLTWSKLGIISFIDKQGGVRALDKIQAAFWPTFYLSDIDIRRSTRGGGGDFNGRYPVRLSGSVSILTSDISKLDIYSNGKLVRSYPVNLSPGGQPRIIRLIGDAYGVWTIIAHDRYGEQPVSKSYSFYPRVTVFPQDSAGNYQIGFLPGSAANSLDRFFLIGSSVSKRAIRSEDPMVSIF